jgi:hypothetical protein
MAADQRSNATPLVAGIPDKWGETLHSDPTNLEIAAPTALTPGAEAAS